MEKAPRTRSEIGAAAGLSAPKTSAAFAEQAHAPVTRRLRAKTPRSAAFAEQAHVPVMKRLRGKTSCESSALQVPRAGSKRLGSTLTAGSRGAKKLKLVQVAGVAAKTTCSVCGSDWTSRRYRTHGGPRWWFLATGKHLCNKCWQRGHGERAHS